MTPGDPSEIYELERGPLVYCNGFGEVKVLLINTKSYIGQMYPTELEFKDTAESNTSAS